jgi:DNA-binding CsgD family transcriptional regulator
VSPQPFPGRDQLASILRELDEVAADAAARSDVARLAHALRMTVEALGSTISDSRPGGDSRPAGDSRPGGDSRPAGVARPLPAQILTPSELLIAELVRQGLTNRQVARRIHISPHTVNYHLRQIYRKLDICSRVTLAGLPWPDKVA